MPYHTDIANIKGFNWDRQKMSNSLQLPLIEAVSRLGLADGHRFSVEEGGSRVFSDELSALKRYYELF